MEQLRQNLPSVPQNQHRHCQQKEPSNEPVAFQNCAVRAGYCASYVAQPHRQCVLVQNVICDRKESHRRDVRREVDKLGARRGDDEFVAENAHKTEYKETTRAWAEEPVIEPDGCSDTDGDQCCSSTLQAGRIAIAKVMTEKSVSRHGNKQNEDKWLCHGWLETSNYQRSQKGEQKCGDRSGNYGPPVEIDSAAVLECCHCGATH